MTIGLRDMFIDDSLRTLPELPNRTEGSMRNDMDRQRNWRLFVERVVSLYEDGLEGSAISG